MPSPRLTQTALMVDGKPYALQIRRAFSGAAPPSVPRLVVVAYQPNAPARRLLETCLTAIQWFTHEPHELWVVDNHSPEAHSAWLHDWPNLNVIFNHTEPVPPGADSSSTQEAHGSYANGLALELAAQVIDPASQCLMTLHMDTAPCHPSWLAFLRGQLNDRVRAAGVRLDRVRVPEGVLHVLGYLVDFQVFRRLGLSFMPALPDLDVGDRVTLALRAAGYEVFACANTLWQPELAALIPSDSPVYDQPVDRSFDQAGQVIFLHLGRGLAQAAGRAGQRRVTLEDWRRLVAACQQHFADHG